MGSYRTPLTWERFGERLAFHTGASTRRVSWREGALRVFAILT